MFKILILAQGLSLFISQIAALHIKAQGLSLFPLQTAALPINHQNTHSSLRS